MNLFLIGINHRTASLETRERVWLSEEEMRAALAALKGGLFAEAAIVSTCNRTEIYVTFDEGALSPDLEERTMSTVIGTLRSLKPGAAEDVQPTGFHVLRGCRAASHLFKVASGIDSLAVGDVQVLGQVKTAFEIAEQAGVLGTMLQRLGQCALHAAKRARAETSIMAGAVSVSYAAVELASKVFAGLASKSILLIGAGETGELTARHLLGKGVGSIAVANRTRARAEALVSSLGGSVAEYPVSVQALSAVDIVVSSVAAEEFVLTKSDVRSAMRNRPHRPLVMIDIGVPRNIDPAANGIENVFLYDMDALKLVVEQNRERRLSEIPVVNAIVLEELKAFLTWVGSLQAGPIIAGLREYFEKVRHDEVMKHRNRFNTGDQELLDLVTKRIVNKLLHEPTVRLRNGKGLAPGEKLTLLSAVRGLFGVGGPDSNGRRG